MLPLSVKKAAFFCGALYVGALPISFLVGGFLFARPLRTGLNPQDVIEAVRPEWDRSFLSLMKEVEVTVRPRVKIRGTVFVAGSHSTVIVLHSRARNRLEGMEAAYNLWNAGFDVLLLDRFAHGRSDGDQRPLFGREENELRLVINELARNEWTGTYKIGILGLGDAGTSALLAAANDERVDAVAAENPALTATELIHRSLASWAPLPRPLLTPHALLMSHGMRLVSDVTPADLDATPALERVKAPTLVLAVGDGGKAARRVYDRLPAGVGAFESGGDHAATIPAMIRFFERNL